MWSTLILMTLVTLLALTYWSEHPTYRQKPPSEKRSLLLSIISLFHKIYSDKYSGPLEHEYILRNTIHTAFTVPDAALYCIQTLDQHAVS